MTSARFALAVVTLLVAIADGAVGQCGEPPADYCSIARVIPGTPGVHEVLVDVHSATAVQESACGIPVGHSVWFEVTPTVSGLLTFSTCHPNTTYDTVAAAWRGGDGDCEFMELVDCVDDTPRPECVNGCSSYGSVLSLPVTAGERYRFMVGSYNNNAAGCNLCLGVIVTLCDPTDATPPTAALAAPGPLACVCDVTEIYGTAAKPGGTIAGWTLEFAPASGGAWWEISTGSTAVVGGLLGTWNATGLSEGYYLLRLTVWDACELASTAVQVVWLDRQMDSLQLRAPSSGEVVGGIVCADGTAWDHCGGAFALEYRPAGGGYVPFDTMNPPWILNDPLGSWNTRAGTPDGSYAVRLSSVDACEHSSAVGASIEVDNTAPVAEITSPVACDVVDGVVQVLGTAADAHLLDWTLAYTGGPASGWVTIASGSSSVVDGVLGSWDAGALPECAYTLRLLVTDRAVIDCNGALHNQAEHLVSVRIGSATPCPGDVDGDRDVDLDDLLLVLGHFAVICP